MKHENNPFSLHVGDTVTIKGDANDQWYRITGFTAEGRPMAQHDSGLRIPALTAGMINSVIRRAK